MILCIRLAVKYSLRSETFVMFTRAMPAIARRAGNVIVRCLSVCPSGVTLRYGAHIRLATGKVMNE